MDLRTLSNDELRTHTPVAGGSSDYWIAHMTEVTRRFFNPEIDRRYSEADLEMVRQEGYEQGYGQAEADNE